MANFVVFLGAGASVPFGIPTMTSMVEDFRIRLESRASPLLSSFQDVRDRLGLLPGIDIEALITVLQDMIDIDRAVARLSNNPSIRYFYWPLTSTRVNQLMQDAKSRAEAEKLLKEVKSFIADCCRIKGRAFDIYDAFFQQVMSKEKYDFRQELEHAKVTRSEPQTISTRCMIFTTNYDHVLEAYCQSRNLAYECGQAQNSTLELSTKNIQLYSENSIFKIYKLHGSTNWYLDEEKRLRWMTEPALTGKETLLGDHVAKELLIYPAMDKYTFREPFYAMFHYLKEQLSKCERCYVVGYSFRDDDILGLFHDAMDLNKKLRLLLIDPNADSIARDKFQSLSDRINIVQKEFSVQAAETLA